MISVLVVDDSVVIRRLITNALSVDPKIRVAGTATNGRVALSKIDQLRPDVVTLDVEMPVLNGLETLRALRKKHPHLPVIMFSTLTAAGASATFDALAAGASDYVTKPSNVGSIAESIRSVQEQLIPRIHALHTARTRLAPIRAAVTPIAPGRAGTGKPGPSKNQGPGSPPAKPGVKPGGRPGAKPAAGRTPPATVQPPPRRQVSPPVRPSTMRTDRPEVLAIGCSTGGPDALSKVLRALPAALPVPVVVVQHMPPVFTKMFAERLDLTCGLKVVEATSDLRVAAGTVYIAPGDFHLEVVRRGTEVITRLQSSPPENFCRPSVDVLFRSVAQIYGRATLAVVLTGMGHDGRKGCEVLHQAGAEIIAQDEATSVVWGMPGAITNAGLAHAVLPLDEVAQHLIARITGGRRSTSMEVTR